MDRSRASVRMMMGGSALKIEFTRNGLDGVSIARSGSSSFEVLIHDEEVLRALHEVLQVRFSSSASKSGPTALPAAAVQRPISAQPFQPIPNTPVARALQLAKRVPVVDTFEPKLSSGDA